MDQSEIDMRDEQLNSLWDKSQELLNGLEKSDRRELDLLELQRMTREFENAFDNFKIELQALSKKEQNKYKKKRKEHGDRLVQLRNDVEFKSQQTNRDALLGGPGGENGTDLQTEDGVIQHGRQVLQDSKDSLERTLGVVNQTTAIGVQVTTQLQKQTEQIEKAYETMDEIESTLKRSTKIINRMARKVATDKYIWVLAFLVLAAILFIIIWTAVKKKQG